MTSAHRKTAAVLQWNVKRLAEKWGIQRLGFLTLTFADHVTDAREASRRFNSLATRVLRGRYAEWIRVLERQKSRRVHYHLLVVLSEDVRTGANFAEFEAGVYRSANDKLRSEWAFWRKTAPNYRFGRTELLPVKSSDEAIAKYVGKYIAKHVGQRIEEDKGVRLVAYSRGANNSNCKFSWASPGAKNHRRKLAFVGKFLGYSPEDYTAGFQRDFGSRWAYRLGQWIAAIRFNDYPTAEELQSDWGPEGWSIPHGSTNCSIHGSSVDERVQLSKRNALLMALFLREPNNFKTSNQPSTQREKTRSEHRQGGDFCASDATAVLRDWMRKNTTFTSAVEGYNQSAQVG